MKIRISQGVGSNPKLWAVGGNRHIGEFDISDEPGTYNAEANGAPTLRISDLAWDSDGWPISAESSASAMSLRTRRQALPAGIARRDPSVPPTIVVDENIVPIGHSHGCTEL